MAVEPVGEQGVSLSCCLFSQRKLMWRQKWAQHENRGRERKKSNAEGSKGFIAGSLAFQVMDMLVLL